MRKKRDRSCKYCGATKHLKTVSLYPSRKSEHVCARDCRRVAEQG